MDALHSAFVLYFVRAKDQIDALGKAHLERTPSRTDNPEVDIASMVEDLEESTDFATLVRITQETFLSNFHSAKSEYRWKQSVRTFFKRSGFYILDGILFDQERLFHLYCDTFQRRTRSVRYFAPLEFVAFAQRCIDCGSFEIRRFSKAELDEFLATTVNRVFYKYAVTDTRRLSDYWFLVVDEVEKSHQISTRLTLDLSVVGSVFSTYSPPPAPIERSLRTLALFDWQLATPQSEYLTSGLTRAGLPLVIRISDDLLGPPQFVPDLSDLVTDTQSDYEGNEYEVPAIYARVEEDACKCLGDFCHQVGPRLKVFASDHPWHFFEVGMTYLVRAFLTRGLDELLWEVIALEALLGGGVNEPVQSTIQKRLGAILGETRAAQKSIQRRFRDFYRLRCDLVHGSRLISSMDANDLAEIRDLTRRTSLFFTNWLHAIELETHAEINPPLAKRSQLLRVLDLSRDQRAQITGLLRHLPSSFPYVREWLK